MEARVKRACGPLLNSKGPQGGLENPSCHSQPTEEREEYVLSQEGTDTGPQAGALPVGQLRLHPGHLRDLCAPQLPHPRGRGATPSLTVCVAGSIK